MLNGGDDDGDYVRKQKLKNYKTLQKHNLSFLKAK